MNVSTMYRTLLAGLVAILISACGGAGDSSAPQVIEDLPFAHAKDAKAYADLVLKAIKTNRGKVLADEFAPETPLNKITFNRLVSMYSTGIGGRKDWEEYDFHALSESTDQSQGFDYAWLDQKGRLGLQLYVKPVHDGKRYYIEALDFRSRLKVMDSVGFPSGEDIDDYKKVEYDWEAAKKQ